MNYLSQYTLSFSGLKEGKHLFDFSVDERFFAGIGGSEVEKGKVIVRIELEKRSTYLRLRFMLKGEVELICDRCLEPYQQPFESSFPMLVKFSETETDDGDEVIYIHPGSHEVEVAQLIYEFIVLSIPIRHVHPEDDGGKSLCDPVMLEKLDQYKAPEIQEIDPEKPVWNELRKIIGK